MEELLKKLIGFQSDHNHPSEIKRCFNFVVADLKKAGLKVKTYSSNGKPSLIAAWKLKKNYQYILNGHLDIVPADYPHAFKPLVKGNRLYGRGASDMKGPVAALMELIKDEDLKSVDMALMLTFDEEIGGKDGVDYLLVEKGYSCDCAIVPDGGDNFRLIINQKGVIRAKFIAKGKSVHSSQLWLGNNALEKLIRLYQEVKKKIPDTTKDNRWRSTLNLGSLHGGDAGNKVPDKAEMVLDFRYPEKKEREKILNLIDRKVKEIKGASFHFLVQRPPMVVNKKSRYIKKIVDIAKQHGVNCQLDKEPWASDAVYFSIKGSMVIVIKPIAGPYHVKNEWIDLKSLKKFYIILKDFLLN